MNEHPEPNYVQLVTPTNRRAYLRIQTPRDSIKGKQLAAMIKQAIPTAEECRAMLLSARRTHQLTQCHLAYLLKLPATSVGDWERGKRTPTTAARQRIAEVCRALNVTQ